MRRNDAAKIGCSSGNQIVSLPLECQSELSWKSVACYFRFCLLWIVASLVDDTWESDPRRFAEMFKMMWKNKEFLKLHNYFISLRILISVSWMGGTLVTIRSIVSFQLNFLLYQVDTLLIISKTDQFLWTGYAWNSLHEMFNTDSFRANASDWMPSASPIFEELRAHVEILE